MPNSLDENNFDVRLSVTETKIVGIEDDLGEHKVMLKDIAVKIDGVKGRFDKMNGSIPHIENTLKSIEKHLEGVTKISHEQETKIAKNTTYVRLLWALIIPVVLTVTGAMIKIAFFGN